MTTQKPNVIAIACGWPVVRRALIMSLIVGTILIVINHCNCCISAGSFGTTCVIKAGLTLLVPYCVSTVSSVLAYCDKN